MKKHKSNYCTSNQASHHPLVKFVNFLEMINYFSNNACIFISLGFIPLNLLMIIPYLIKMSTKGDLFKAFEQSIAFGLFSGFALIIFTTIISRIAETILNKLVNKIVSDDVIQFARLRSFLFAEVIPDKLSNLSYSINFKGIIFDYALIKNDLLTIIRNEFKDSKINVKINIL